MHTNKVNFRITFVSLVIFFITNLLFAEKIIVQTAAKYFSDTLEIDFIIKNNDKYDILVPISFWYINGNYPSIYLGMNYPKNTFIFNSILYIADSIHCGWLTEIEEPIYIWFLPEFIKVKKKDTIQITLKKKLAHEYLLSDSLSYTMKFQIAYQYENKLNYFFKKYKKELNQCILKEKNVDIYLDYRYNEGKSARFFNMYRETKYKTNDKDLLKLNLSFKKKLTAECKLELIK